MIEKNLKIAEPQISVEDDSDQDQNHPVTSSNNSSHNENDGETEKKEKKRKRGIVYLSTIPKHMNITKIREIFSAYGQLGRVYLQLRDTEAGSDAPKRRRKTCSKHFTEGWIEFESKRVAKYVAAHLNNTQVSTRKKSKFYDVIWNVKYLPRFKWVHLSERLAYEKAVHRHRLRTEIAQAKREATFFSHNVDKSKKLRRAGNRKEQQNLFPASVKQKKTDAEIRSMKEESVSTDQTSLIQSLFS